MGGLELEQGKLLQAEDHLLSSIRINNRPGYETGDALTAKLKLTDLYIRSGRKAEAQKWLENSRQQLISQQALHRKDDASQLRWHRPYWQYADHWEAVTRAYQSLQRYYTSQDSLREVNLGLRNADMEMAFRSSAQQSRLALLNKENERKSDSLRAVLIITLLILLLLAVIVFYLRRSKHQVTELINLNRQIGLQNIRLLEALNALEQSQQEHAKLLKIVAHDLRNPVGSMTMLAALLLKDQSRKKKDRHLIELIEKSGRTALELVSELLQVQKPGDLLVKEPMDLAALLEFCAGVLRPLAAEKSQKIELDTLTLTVNTNREKLWRVVSNLVANAIKFSQIGASIRIRLDLIDGEALISVNDQGIGIPDHLKDQIFSTFAGIGRKGTAGEQTFG